MRFLAILCICVFVVTPASATTVERMELPQLVSSSDNIIQGRVESLESRYEGNRIYTYISITVDEPLKGAARKAVLVRQLGGSIGAKRTWIPGMPQFTGGSQVIVFLRDRHDGTFDVAGLNQGKYDINNDFAVANISGVTLIDPKTGAMSDHAFIDQAPLETFKAKIRELVR
jgi:hypothetical protein